MTTVVRRDPFHLEMPDWMGRWLDERGLGERLLPEGFLAGAGIRVEELTEEGVHVVRAEMPGVDPEKDVEISVHDGMLHIRGERTERAEHKDKAAYRSEFRYGTFERMLPLPAGTTADDVSATYKDGVLEVRLPMKDEAKQAAKIPVKRG